ELGETLVHARLGLGEARISRRGDVSGCPLFEVSVRRAMLSVCRLQRACVPGCPPLEIPLRVAMASICRRRGDSLSGVLLSEISRGVAMERLELTNGTCQPSSADLEH